MSALLVPPAMLRKMEDLAGAINAADSYAKTDPDKVRFFLKAAASYAAEVRSWMARVNEAGKVNDGH